MKRLTYSNVIASVALFAALGGSSYAAITLPKNSVTSKQVKNHSLLGVDFKKGQLPTGPAGPQGAKGDTGAPGSAVAYARVIVTANGATVDPSQSKGITNANLSRPATGVTCIKGLSFTPKSIVASADIAAGGGGGVPIAGGALAPASAVSAVCGPDGQAAVATEDPVHVTNPAEPRHPENVDASYFVIFE